jgi:hypothetical protein
MAYFDIPWLHLRIGQEVHRHDDERHTGRIIAINSSIYVTVRWDDTGWRSIEHANELRRLR